MPLTDQQLEAYSEEIQTNPKALKFAASKLLSAANTDDPAKLVRIVKESVKAVIGRSVTK